MLKDKRTVQGAADELLRNYLIRCHAEVSGDYPEIATMTPENSANFLLHLRDTGRIWIELYSRTPLTIGCRIVDLHSSSVSK